MDADSRRVKHPLTEEELIVRDVINGTIDTARLPILRALRDYSNPVAQTEAAQQAGITRQAASGHFAVLRDRGFVNSHAAGIELTAGGTVLLDLIDDCLKTMSIDELSHLTRSDHAVVILQELERQPYRLSGLQSAVSSSPSRSTIRRNLDNFEKFDWAVKDAGRHQITAAGSRTLNAYAELAPAVEQLIDKSPWFQRLPPEDATMPVQELADAKLITSNPANPASVLWAALRLFDRETRSFRALTSIYHPVLFSMYRRMFELGIDIEAEVILDLPTYLEAIENHQVKEIVFEAPDLNYQPLVLDHAHTLGIGIYDDRKVAIGAYNEFGSGNHITMIVSSNERLVEWGIKLYESYREKAYDPSELEIK